MSVEDVHDRLVRQLTFYAVLCGGLIALGTVLLSMGGTLIVSTPPQMIDVVHEIKTANLNQTSIVNDINDKFRLVSWEVNNSILFMILGAMLIALGVLCALLRIYASPSQNHSRSQVNDHNVLITVQSSHSTGYDDSKYYETRKRLAYHPPDKMFPNKISEQKDMPKEEPKKPRGTLPKGF